MKLLLCCITVHLCLGHRPKYPPLRQRVVPFHLDNRSSVADSGSVVSHVSKVKCTLMCFENPSCISVFYWKSERKCRTNAAQQPPTEHPRQGKVNSQDPNSKVNSQDPRSKVNRQDPNSKVYHGVLRNVSGRYLTNRSSVSKMGSFQPMEWIYFKEIDLYLIYNNGNKTFKEAELDCKKHRKDGSSLFQVDDQKKQDIAKRLVEHSAQERIFIGVYRMLLGWRHMDLSWVKYTNWAPSEPHYAAYAMLTKKSGYKWKTANDSVKAGWICQRKKLN